MIQPNHITFSTALELALKVVQDFKNTPGDSVLLVRDLFGRIRVILKGTEDNYTGLYPLRDALHKNLGAYSYPPESTILFSESFMDGDALLNDPDRRQLSEEVDPCEIWLLERQITGADWNRLTPIKRETTNPRVTFFGIKGGVGRSTALVIWAWSLAKQGKRVLIFDFDLESPGVSSTLLPKEHLPDYGIVDWFVEDGVGPTQIVEDSIVTHSPLADRLSGDILIAPAFGSGELTEKGDYLSKLARCYADFSSAGQESWGERAQRLVESLEKQVKPDVVIFDSRAGLHDIAAVLVTRMDAFSLLFAVESAQTWDAYSLLFRSWNKHPHELIGLRDRLQVIAGMIPETHQDRHLLSFEEHSWELFREHLYDQDGSDTESPFTFDLNDTEAPHFPLKIFWNRALQEFRPIEEGMDEQIVDAACRSFLSGVSKLFFQKEIY